MDGDGWIAASATLAAQSTHANVWVLDAYYDAESGTLDGASSIDGVLTRSRAELIAQAFDGIYPPATALLGYEYGGGPEGVSAYGQPNGGLDGSPRVNILLYNIEFDNDVHTGESGIIGFFWSKDYLDYPTSNQCEMFYMDSIFAEMKPTVVYSTLAHELQHMINFNRKYIVTQSNTPVETWYDEMLSLTTEDALGPVVAGLYDVPDDYRFTGSEGSGALWINVFNSSYLAFSGTNWVSSNSYASSYMLGAYLVRNYGGAGLVRAILDTKSTAISSVNEALASLGYDGVTLETAFKRIGEAMLFGSELLAPDAVPAVLNTFSRSPEPLALGAHTYSFDPFDPWKFVQYLNPDSSGPVILPLAPVRLLPYAFVIQSDEEWSSPEGGSREITLEKPVSESVSMTLYVRGGPTPGYQVIPVDFGEASSATVAISDIGAGTVYLVRVNSGISTVDALDTGSVVGYAPAAAAAPARVVRSLDAKISGVFGDIIRYEHDNTITDAARFTAGGARANAAEPVDFSGFTVGDTWTFWVDY